MKLEVDGHGLLSGMVRKVLASDQTVAVTSVTTDPIPQMRSVVPDGWKRDQK